MPREVIVPAEIAKMIPIPPPSPEVAAVAANLAQVPTNFTQASDAAAHLANNPGVKQQVERVIAEKPVASVLIIAPGQVIERTKGTFAGSLGHIVSVEADGVICVQQQCDLPALRWFKVPNGEFKVIGKAAGRYKIPEAEIQKNIERFKPKVRKPEE